MQPSSKAASLSERLLTAHAENDAAELVALYQQAAETTPDETIKGFYLTQAYIFALEAGDPAAPNIKAMLVAMGREK